MQQIFVWTSLSGPEKEAGLSIKVSKELVGDSGSGGGDEGEKVVQGSGHACVTISR